jgi:hypothetical protein
MENDPARHIAAESAKRLSARDLLIFIAAVGGVVFFNFGVVRALDVALDVLNR